MNRKNNRRRGKDTEKEIAKLFNGKRIGLLGSEDVFHPKYSIEVKSREKFMPLKWMKQAKNNNKDNKIPLVVIHQKSKPHESDLVLIELKDFLKLEERKS